MNRTSIILAISMLLFCCIACEDEDELSPSGLDTDRVQDLLDWSNPVVKKYYGDYGVALMTDFDENLDIKFNFYESWANSFWKKMEIGKMERKSECDSAIRQFFDISKMSWSFRVKCIILILKRNISPIKY